VRPDPCSRVNASADEVALVEGDESTEAGLQG
jgi:hypothetical protein